MSRLVLFLLSFLSFYLQRSYAQQIDVYGPPGTKAFGSSITVLANGNYVVRDREYSEGAKSGVGAVFLYNGSTKTLISKLTGSSDGDAIGSEGIVALTNGNFVIISPHWNNNRGAVTWASGLSGVEGTVGLHNSLIGNSVQDMIGNNGVTPLKNGNYVIRSYSVDNRSVTDASAVTWGNGTTGTTGVVSLSNSLFGSHTNDYLGVSGIIALDNGNYVIASEAWANGSKVAAGAVTFANGSSAISGFITSTNSLVGEHARDFVGETVLSLATGNYVIITSEWDNGTLVDAGAVTLASGISGITGVITGVNSLIGTRKDQRLGLFDQVVRLKNGSYVVKSPFWDVTLASTGTPVTWGDGITGVVGPVTRANSLITPIDWMSVSITTLTNGNYVVNSPMWYELDGDGFEVYIGATTWGDGTKGVRVKSPGAIRLLAPPKEAIH